MVPQSPYMSDVPLCDFLFLEMRLQLRGCGFHYIPEVYEHSLTILYTITKAISNIAFSSIRKAGPIALSQMGTTFKSTVMTYNKGKCIFRY